GIVTVWRVAGGQCLNAAAGKGLKPLVLKVTAVFKDQPAQCVAALSQYTGLKGFARVLLALILQAGGQQRNAGQPGLIHGVGKVTTAVRQHIWQTSVTRPKVQKRHQSFAVIDRIVVPDQGLALEQG